MIPGVVPAIAGLPELPSTHRAAGASIERRAETATGSLGE
jgi:hypothetical protein